MNRFTQAMNNLTTTENNALTFKSSLDKIVDFFFHGAALRREADESRIISLFQEAFDQDPTQALRILFYIRDIRGGQGERRVFRVILNWLCKSNSLNADAIQRWLVNNLKLIPEYGRWDDLFVFLDSPIRISVLNFIHTQLKDDIEQFNNSTSISLLAKWLPSENASSVITKNRAKMIMSYCNMTPRTYRKLLSTLRKHLDIVERKLSAKQTNLIKYPNVPSKAGLLYKAAFLRNDEHRYKEYLASVEKGEAKINASTLYPYELLEKCWSSRGDKTVDLMWANLPDYIPNINGLVVADTSGSMSGRPMAVSISLAMYIAERNKNEIWKDFFISFTAKPKFHKITGKTLGERARSVQLNYAENTDLQAVFDLILNRAVTANVPAEDMPQVLLVISDMEFDSCTSGSGWRTKSTTNFEAIQKKYKQVGYKMPTLIFWNVYSRNTQSPVTFDERGVVLLSGCSPVAFKYALGSCTSPLEMVYQVTNSDRYNQINWK